MTTNTEQDKIKHLVDDACTRLIEHVDSVQILVTFHTEDGQPTSSYETGRGNFFARLGQVVEWLEMQREYERCEAKRRDETD